MHGYTILHGCDLNEIGNFREGKLVMHGYTILYGCDLDENANFYAYLVNVEEVIIGVKIGFSTLSTPYKCPKPL